MEKSLQKDYWPTTDWREASPQEPGMDLFATYILFSGISGELPNLTWEITQSVPAQVKGLQTSKLPYFKRQVA